MVAIQLKAAALIIGIAAGRKHFVRFCSPVLLEWLWFLPAIRLLLPQWVGIPIITMQYQASFTAFLPGRFKWVQWIVFAILFLSMLISHIRFYGEMRDKKPLRNESVICWMQAHPCRLHDYVYTSAHVRSPMVYGLLFPKIVLPAHKYSSVQYENILLHEWMHIRRGDLWKKAFMMLIVMSNWFNPACWLMLLLYSQDIELACDAGVLRTLHKQEHAVYASVLLDCYSHMASPAILETGFSSGILQERISKIMKQKKMSYKAKCCAVVLFSALFLAAFGKVTGEAQTAAPDLVGKTQSEAEQMLQKHGLGFSVEDAK